MIDTFIRIYQIGKELGLTKREISSLFLSKKPREGAFSKVLLIFLIIIVVTLLSFLIVTSYIYIEKNTYPAGTKYSTVKIKDFRLNRDKLRSS